LAEDLVKAPEGEEAGVIVDTLEENGITPPVTENELVVNDQLNDIPEFTDAPQVVQYQVLEGVATLPEEEQQQLISNLENTPEDEQAALVTETLIDNGAVPSDVTESDLTTSEATPEVPPEVVDQVVESNVSEALDNAGVSDIVQDQVLEGVATLPDEEKAELAEDLVNAPVEEQPEIIQEALENNDVIPTADNTDVAEQLSNTNVTTEDALEEEAPSTETTTEAVSSVADVLEDSNVPPAAQEEILDSVAELPPSQQEDLVETLENTPESEQAEVVTDALTSDGNNND
jgi:hypothetical protein